MKRPLALAAALALSVTAACGTPHEGPATGPVVGSAEPVTVRVTNNNWSDMTVYVISSSQRRRLGSVTSMSTQSFRLPRHMTAGSPRLALVADPIGGMQQFTAPEIDVWPGQVVEFTIQNQLSISSVSSWRE